AQTIDMNDYVCPNRAEGADAQCSAVIGTVIVWYAESHLSPEYSYTLPPASEQEMHEVFPEYSNTSSRTGCALGRHVPRRAQMGRRLHRASRCFLVSSSRVYVVLSSTVWPNEY